MPSRSFRAQERSRPARFSAAAGLTEAVIVRRIFTEFAAGVSPRRIAVALNNDVVPGPLGRAWGDTTIRGHVCRGTGIVNNELYVGRLTWNRLRYVKDPSTGRVSRINPRSEWITTEVPELRIIDEGLWHAVRERQADISKVFVSNAKAVRASRAKRLHELRGRRSCCRACSTAHVQLALWHHPAGSVRVPQSFPAYRARRLRYLRRRSDAAGRHLPDGTGLSLLLLCQRHPEGQAHLQGTKLDTLVDDVLKDRIEMLQTSREIALTALDRARSASRPTHDVSPAAVDRFARAMREKLSTGEVPFRKAYIRSIVDRIEVDDRCIRIMGRKDVLEQAVLAEGGGTTPVVHSFVPKWRARQDLNLRPLA